MRLLSWIWKVMDEATAANCQAILRAMALRPEYAWTEHEIMAPVGLDTKKFDQAMERLVAEGLVNADPELITHIPFYRPKRTTYKLTLKGVQEAQKYLD